ncbi:MAG: DUF169 domain-containing protein [Methanoregulaceae archaeon]
MTALDFRDVGERLAAAFRLTARPLAVYGAETLPSGIPHLPDVNRCLAVSLFRMATGTEVPGIYLSADSKEGCCPGGLAHTGFHPEPGDIKYFVSQGRADIRGGAAEYLKSSPDMVERCFRALGKVTPPGKYLIVQACELLPPGLEGVRSLCCFGTAEQIRNMAALVHFDRDDPFTPVIVPWGPSCSTFITYPAGMAENAPKRTAFMGPQDPTQNHSLPPDIMALGIPADIALAMARNLDASFIIRRPKVAFPDHAKRTGKTER